MTKFLVFLLAAIMMSIGVASLSFAGGAMAEKAEGVAPTPQALQGELLAIEGEFYVVKDQAGKEVRLHVDKSTEMIGSIAVGTTIQVKKTPTGHAISLEAVKVKEEKEE